MVRSHLVGVGRVVGGAVLCATAVALGAPAAEAAGPAAAATVSPEPASAQLAPPVTGSVGSAGLYAVGGGLVVVAGGAAMWVRRKKAGKVTIH